MADITLEIQAKVEKFASELLAEKSQLLEVQRRTQLLTVKDRATILLSENQDLEKQLLDMLPKIQAMKDTGSFDLALVSSSGVLYYQLQTHMSKVKQLLKDAGVDASVQGGWDLKTIFAASTVVLLVLWFLSRPRRS